jgi:hypothetical protein
MMLGGALSALMEPTLDNIVLFWWPRDPNNPPTNQLFHVARGRVSLVVGAF